LDDNEKAYYERQQIFLMDEKARLESAKARLERAENKGKLEKSIEIAKLLKQNGVETELIIKSTGLSKEQIEKL